MWKGNLNLANAAKHIFFMSDSELLELIKTLVDKKLPEFKACLNNREALFGSDWTARLDKCFTDFIVMMRRLNLRDKQASSQETEEPSAQETEEPKMFSANAFYSGTVIFHLLKLIRNLSVHSEKINTEMAQLIGPHAERVILYFTLRYAALATVIYVCSAKNNVPGIKVLSDLIHNEMYLTATDALEMRDSEPLDCTC